MSKYTTELRFICEQLCGYTESQDYAEVDAIITQSAPKIFSFSFPIFDEEYRSELEQKIIRHFYTREIGMETYALWKLKLQTKLNEIMPYYNQLYNSTLLEFNPLRNYAYEKEGGGHDSKVERKTTGLQTSTHVVGNTDTVSADTGLYWDKYSDTPQSGVNGLDSDTYLTNARKNTSQDNGTNNVDYDSDTTGTSTEQMNGGNEGAHDYIEKCYGYIGVSGSKLLSEFRETFLNIDMMIIGELEELFMQLW